MLGFGKKKKSETLSSVGAGSGWLGLIRESFSGAWQRNIEVSYDTVLAYHAIFACITLIASDIAKMRVNMMRKDGDIWTETTDAGFNVLTKPNDYQNRIQFYEQWMTSKLSRGNTYVLKKRDNKGKVVKLFILNPDLVIPLVSESGAVYYQLGTDNLSELAQVGNLVVPATEIIHDRFNCLFHPLVGLSPIYACGLAAAQGLKIQNNSALFFDNMSRPSGILTAPGSISDETAARLKAHWEENYGGEKIGKTAVLGDDLKYMSIAISAEDSQLVEQLKMTAEIVCATFHVPPYKVLSDAPNYNNIEALEQQYYSQCLQILIESAELCLKEGLEVPDGKSVEFDLDGLLRMDSSTKMKTLTEGVKGFVYTPNEARQKLNAKPLKGGNTVYIQQQNWPMELLAEREADDLKETKPVAAAPAAADDDKDPDATIENSIELMGLIEKEFMRVMHHEAG